MKKIDNITPEQAARFDEWAEKWINIGLSTEPADFDRATAAALKAYEVCNLERPMVILRMGSPYAATVGGAIAWAILREIPNTLNHVGRQVGRHALNQIRRQVESQVQSEVESLVRSRVESRVRRQVESLVQSEVESLVRSRVESRVRRQVESLVWNQVGRHVEGRVRGQVGSPVDDEVESLVRSRIGGMVWGQVGSQVLGQIRSRVERGISNDWSGAFWASWVAHFSFFRDVLGWSGDTLPLLQIKEDLVQSCGWIWWHENVLVISDRPSEINRDDQGRLHSHNGPSISYRDGWALYHSHGTAIPSKWIENKASLTPRVALTCTNIEQRRAGCEILGWDTILRELGARVIDTDVDPQIGELVEVDIPDIGRERFIRVRCGTGRWFALPVPPTMTTALEANAWTYNIPPNLLQQKETRT